MSTPSHMKRFPGAYSNIPLAPQNVNIPFATKNRLHLNLNYSQRLHPPSFLDAFLNVCKYFADKTYSTRNIDTQTVCKSYSEFKSLRPLIWGIYGATIAPCPRARRNDAKRWEKGGTFHGEMCRCRESQGWTTACYARTRREGPRRGQPKATGLVLVRSP